MSDSRQPGMIDRWPGLRAWARRHGYSLLSSLGNLWRQPLASAMTVGVLALTLFLPAGLYHALDNVSRAVQGWERLDTISVFLETGASSSQAMTMASNLSARPGVVAVDPISPDEGLAELSAQLAVDDLDELVSDNPLPWVLAVLPARETETAALAGELQSLDGVERVIVDLQWIERLEAMLSLVRHLVWLLGILLALAAGLIVGNTIRLDIHARREEIGVLALVGATAGFIRRPFLYSGLWYGLLGGILAWLLLCLAVGVLSAPIERLSATYAASFSPAYPDAVLSGILLAASGALGVAGSWLAVGRHLRRIHPA